MLGETASLETPAGPKPLPGSVIPWMDKGMNSCTISNMALRKLDQIKRETDALTQEEKL